MRKILGRALISCFIILSSVGAQADLLQERILLTFIPNIQFAPFYVGIANGHFARQGFEVTLEHLQEPDVLDLVAAGQADFGIVSGEQVILARSKGRDVVYVYEWFQEYPVGIVMVGDNGAGDLENLTDMIVGIPGRFGASYSGLTTLLQSAGLSEDDIELNEIGFNAPDVFCLGAVDAAVVYVNNEPLQIRDRLAAGDCGDVRGITVVSVASQVDLVSNGLIVSADLAGRDPDKVQRLVSGFNSALKATISNPANAYLASGTFVETLPGEPEFLALLRELAAEQAAFLATNPTREQIAQSRSENFALLAGAPESDDLTQYEVLLRTIELWDADTLGHSDLSSWEAMSDTLRLMGLLSDDVPDLGASFSNQFVTGIRE
ncbi:MAG: ABC transporter substrate-binding protein [Chloroflexi bacterium]|nr:ABC transporter substrate-binding protein [Chloroflexota bacterium]